MKSKFNRRDFLKFGAVGAAALLLGDLLKTNGQTDLNYINTFFKVPLTPTSPASAGLSSSTQCQLNPVVLPPRPVYVPRRAELDPATGLHMTGSPVFIDLPSYSLKVTGKVDHPLQLSYDELRCMPKVTSPVTIVCKGYFEDYSIWGGVPIAHVLERAGVQHGATAVNMKAGDGYVNQPSLEESLSPDAFFAYEWLNSQALPVLFGFPLRAVFPSQYGYYDVKWLLEVEVV
jgi:DMSO/TMAO reductase YedYZ molybdopterin-dependent catalytic subunit